MKRIKELDFTRVIAMFAVVMIHVTSTYINQDSSFILFDMNLLNPNEMPDKTINNGTENRDT